MVYFDHDFKEFPELTNAQLELLQFVSPHKQIVEDFDASVVKVHDGDTLTLNTSFRAFDFPLRLLDIDAPELNAGGEVAREWLKQKILGREVRVLIDAQNRVGKYGRLLGRILYNGLDVADEMLHLGLVKSFAERKEGDIPSAAEYFASEVAVYA